MILASERCGGCGAPSGGEHWESWCYESERDEARGERDILQVELQRERAVNAELAAAMKILEARAVTEEDRQALITALAVCGTAAANDRAILAHLIAEGADKVRCDVYRRGAERADAAAAVIQRIAGALPAPRRP